MIFFTSDTHFCHTKVIEKCNRPFASIEDMNEGLIRNWNEVVGPRDEVWHLGDFSFDNRRTPEILSRLNGSIHLIRGNHDPRSDEACRKMGFASSSMANYIKREGQSIYLHHSACRVWWSSNRGSWCLFGHSHGARKDLGKSTDVGVDCWNYRPVSFDTLKERFKDRPDIDHHQEEPEDGQ
jgi:calcineurin-like phosphoesterase family protein